MALLRENDQQITCAGRMAENCKAPRRKAGTNQPRSPSAACWGRPRDRPPIIAVLLLGALPCWRRGGHDRPPVAIGVKAPRRSALGEKAGRDAEQALRPRSNA